jgi:hypothetical protein
MDKVENIRRPSAIYRWIISTICGLIIIFYLIFSAGLLPNLSGLINNILFTCINLLATIYITREISLWGWQSENILNQKKIAKTAIRHNRTNLYIIDSLLTIVDDKISKVQDALIKQYFIEIKNQLLIINGGIRNSEADFNDIVNEELHEELYIQKQILELQDIIDEKNKQLTKFSEKSKNDKEFEELVRQIQANKMELLNRKIDMPFGTTYTPNGIGHIIPDSVIFTRNSKENK